MKERLIGGMALPRGVLFMTEERLAAGYYDEEGQLRLHTQPVSLHRFRWAGLLGRAILLPFEAWRLEHDRAGDVGRVGANALLAGAVLGFPTGLWLRSGPIPEWVPFFIFLALLALPYFVYPPFRQAVQQIRRYHAAEHMAIHALMQGEGSREAPAGPDQGAAGRKGGEGGLEEGPRGGARGEGGPGGLGPGGSGPEGPASALAGHLVGASAVSAPGPVPQAWTPLNWRKNCS